MGSGVAWRLARTGFKVIITEIPRPTAIRRWVCFAEAVYNDVQSVEGVEARLCKTISDIARVHDAGQIAVVVSAEVAELSQFQADAIVDAMLLKEGKTTPRGMADKVIGLGPGFIAGEDVSCVIETNRGPNLGRCIWHGAAEANTGIPGSLGGETLKRVLRAPFSGVLEPLHDIGSTVRVGDIVARVGSADVRSQLDGIVRGMIRAGTHVSAGMKIGDIDPRGSLAICRRISDKALAIAGGVLEALLSDPPANNEHEG